MDDVKTTKHVRLELTLEYHHLLRKVAAEYNMSMAEYARTFLVAMLNKEAKDMGIDK